MGHFEIQIFSPVIRGRKGEYQQLLKVNLGHEQSHYLISLVKPFNYILVPFFFVYAGMQVGTKIRGSVFFFLRR